jgi:hypothetical protein
VAAVVAVEGSPIPVGLPGRLTGHGDPQREMANEAGQALAVAGVLRGQLALPVGDRPGDAAAVRGAERADCVHAGDLDDDAIQQLALEGVWPGNGQGDDGGHPCRNARPIGGHGPAEGVRKGKAGHGHRQQQSQDRGCRSRTSNRVSRLQVRRPAAPSHSLASTTGPPDWPPGRCPEGVDHWHCAIRSRTPPPGARRAGCPRRLPGG